MFSQIIQTKTISPQHLLKLFYDNLINRQPLLITAIMRQRPTFGQQSAAIFNNSNATLYQSLTSIIKGIYEFIQEHFGLVPDDYQPLKDNEDVNYFAGRFIKYTGENCRLNEQNEVKNLPQLLRDFWLLLQDGFFGN